MASARVIIKIKLQSVQFLRSIFAIKNPNRMLIKKVRQRNMIRQWLYRARRQMATQTVEGARQAIDLGQKMLQN